MSSDKITKDIDNSYVYEQLELSKAIKSQNVSEVKSLTERNSYWTNNLNKKLLQSISIYINDQNENIKEIILILINKSADVDLQIDVPQKKEKLPIVFIAALKGDLSFLKSLLKFKPNICFTDSNGKNLLINTLEAIKGIEEPVLIDVFMILLQLKINLNQEDSIGNTALTVSVSKGFVNITSLLIRYGANVNHQVKGYFNNTSLHLSIQMENINMIKLLMTYSPNLQLVNTHGRNVLDEAGLKQNPDIKKLLQEEYLRLKKENSHGQLSLSTIGNKSQPIQQLQDSSLSLNISKKSSHKLTDIIQVNSINQQHQISERDLKLANLKVINEGSKVTFEKIIRPKVINSYQKSGFSQSLQGNSYVNTKINTNFNLNLNVKQEDLLKKCESEIDLLSEENIILKNENDRLRKEIKDRESLIEIKDEELKHVSGTSIHNYIQKQGSHSFSNLNFSQKQLFGLSNLTRREILERKFGSIMYRDDYVVKCLHKDLIDFQEYNKDSILKLKPKLDELLNYIKQLVEETIPEYIVQLYGSHATGLCLNWSDLDIVLINKSEFESINIVLHLQSLYYKLSDKGWISNIKFIESATIPIIKIIASDYFNNMNIDISIQDSKHYGMKCVNLVKDYISEFEALEPLLYALKNLLKNGNLNNPYTGGLSSYGLILMLVSFLQNQRQNSKCIKINDLLNPFNLGKLFLEFCWYYGIMFDHTKYVINAYPLNGSEMYADKESLPFLSVSLIIETIYNLLIMLMFI